MKFRHHKNKNNLANYTTQLRITGKTLVTFRFAKCNLINEPLRLRRFKYHVVITRNMLLTYNTKHSQHSASSLCDSKKSKTDYFTKCSNDHINHEIMAINSLNIADGLKELLIKYGFTLEDLLHIPAFELAEFLGIDLYVAKIICGAARKLSNYP